MSRVIAVAVVREDPPTVFHERHDVEMGAEELQFSPIFQE